MEQRKVDCTSKYISNLWYNFTSHYNIGFFLAEGKIIKFSKVMINNKQGFAFVVKRLWVWADFTGGVGGGPRA